MSQLNIKGLVSTIKGTSAYAPIVEAINNAIYSIEKSGRDDGEIVVTLHRDKQKLPLPSGDGDDQSLPEINSVTVTDNGEGFTDSNLKHFDTAYTDHKVTVGGKGFGRFLFLHHFNDVYIESVYGLKDGSFMSRSFELGKSEDIVYGLKEEDSFAKDSSTSIKLTTLVEGKLDKKLSTVSRKILERILIHFSRSDFTVPNIVVEDEHGDSLILNELVTGEKYAEIKLLDKDSVTLGEGEQAQTFEVTSYKIWFPENQKSKISLTSHYLEVTQTPIEEYINEFEGGFSGEFESRNGEKSNRYIIKLYVTGEYLDSNVSTERAKFDFGNTGDKIYPFGKRDIEIEVAKLAEEKFKNEVKTRRDDKKEKVESFVKDSRQYLARYESRIDLGSLPLNPKPEDIEIALEKERIKHERDIEIKAETLVNSDAKNLVNKKTEELISEITESNKDNLARYVAHRSSVISIFEKSLEVNKDGKYTAEEIVHDLIYPIRSDSDKVPPGHQNLWLVDERLNFTDFISSDQQMSKKNKKRGDLFIFHNKIAFRAGDDKQQPVTILEFKKPGRDDFVNPSSKEDPVDQVVRYVRDIKAGKFKTSGRPIHTDKNTQFYGYIIVDFTEKVKKWASEEKDFTPMPDGLGYYKWWSNINLYIEIISWDKLIKDAKLRNMIFTQKLGIGK